jgi:hypothetical protein
VNIRDVRDIKVTAIRGEHDGQTGYVSVWPIFHLQDWVNVAWPDGTVTTAHPGDIIAPDEAAQIERHAAVEARVHQLARASKRDLLTIVMQHARQRRRSWAVGGPSTWSKDELINGALEFEFGEAEIRQALTDFPDDDDPDDDDPDDDDPEAAEHDPATAPPEMTP